MIFLNNKTDCSGCTACFSICPKSAITMKADGMGFKYPEVDSKTCIECGLCEKVCSFNEGYLTPDNYDNPIPYGARQKDLAEIEKSRSGAVFAAVSDYILNKGGVIYGAGYDNSFRVLHKRAVNKEERDEFRGSKYVQSDMGDIFKEVERDLKSGLSVLFSGTPCQTAGLCSFLRLKRIETGSLIVCDIVCHGVPSPKLWKDYLDYLSRKEKKQITAVNFRDKSRFGWKAHKESFIMDDTYTYTYTYTFYQHIMFRPACGVCPYTNFRRTGDITLGDFWGWEKTDENFNSDDKGVSLVLINTPKGKDIFDLISPKLNIIPTSLHKCLQPNLQHPSLMHPDSAGFSEYYIKHGFKRTMNKYGMMGWKHDLLKYRLKIESLMKVCIKSLLIRIKLKK